MLTTWSIWLLAVPSARIAVVSGQLSVALVVAGSIVATLGCLLALARYRLSGLRSMLAMALAFLALLVNQLIRSAELVQGRAASVPDVAIYVWRTGRLVAGALFLVMAMRLTRDEEPVEDLGRIGIRWGAIVVGALAIIDAALLAMQDRLPALMSSGRPTAANVLLDLAVAAPFIVAAVILASRSDGRTPFEVWLPAAFLMAAASQVHNLLYPVAGSDRLTSADLLRFASVGLLFVAIVLDVARTLVADARLARRLEVLTREREELSRLVTHDLRHAVGSLRNFATALRVRWSELPERQRVDLVRRMERETARVRDLAEETVLIMGDGRAPAPRIRSESVRDLVEGAIEAFDDTHAGLRVDMDPHVALVLVAADRTQIYRVLRNLLGNAYRHGRGKDVGLDVTGDEQSVRFRIVDAGPGLPSWVNGAREPTSRPTSQDGWGLGLHICEEIVRAHGGSMTVGAADPTGAEVTFVLPRAG